MVMVAPPREVFQAVALLLVVRLLHLQLLSLWVVVVRVMVPLLSTSSFWNAASPSEPRAFHVLGVLRPVPIFSHVGY